MIEKQPITMSSIVLDAPDARELAAFYRRLLGWTVVADEPRWVKLSPPDGGTGISFQTEDDYVRPVWPSGLGEQQMISIWPPRMRGQPVRHLRSSSPRSRSGYSWTRPATHSACSAAARNAAGWSAASSGHPLWPSRPYRYLRCAYRVVRNRAGWEISGPRSARDNSP